MGHNGIGNILKKKLNLFLKKWKRILWLWLTQVGKYKSYRSYSSSDGVVVLFVELALALAT